MDTDMTAGVEAPRSDPADIARIAVHRSVDGGPTVRWSPAPPPGDRLLA
jgi:hypothetical protein